MNKVGAVLLLGVEAAELPLGLPSAQPMPLLADQKQPWTLPRSWQVAKDQQQVCENHSLTVIFSLEADAGFQV